MANSDSEARPDWNTDSEEYSSGESDSGGSAFSDIPQYCMDGDIAVDSNGLDKYLIDKNEQPNKRNIEAEKGFVDGQSTGH